jgi:hypothetical protein
LPAKLFNSVEGVFLFAEVPYCQDGIPRQNDPANKGEEVAYNAGPVFHFHTDILSQPSPALVFWL